MPRQPRFQRSSNIDIYRGRARLTNAHALSGRGKNRQHTEFVNQNILKHLRLTSTSHVMDVGCGSGDLLVSIADAIGQGTGIVPTAEERDRLREEIREGKLSFAVGLSSTLPAKDNSVDVLIINGVILLLDSLHQAEETLAETARVVRPGGEVWLGELACRGFAQERRTYTGSSMYGYLMNAWQMQGLRGCISAVRDLFKAYTTGQPIQLRSPALITPRDWVVDTAAKYGLRLLHEEEHVGLDAAGNPQPSSYRRNFKLRKEALAEASDVHI